MDEKEELIDRVDEITTTTFTIAGCPMKTFKRFVRFCEHNAKATKVFYNQGKRQIKDELVYSIALGQLLDAYEADAKVNMLYDRIVAVESAVEQQQRMGEKEVDEKPKTFGRKDEVKKSVEIK